MDHIATVTNLNGCWDNAGRVAPVDPSNNSGMMGLGKASLDSRMLDNTTLARKELESQKIAKETPDQRKARMVRISATTFIFPQADSCASGTRCLQGRCRGRNCVDS